MVPEAGAAHLLPVPVIQGRMAEPAAPVSAFGAAHTAGVEEVAGPQAAVREAQVAARLAKTRALAMQGPRTPEAAEVEAAQVARMVARADPAK
jgi:hypothetical protein